MNLHEKLKAIYAVHGDAAEILTTRRFLFFEFKISDGWLWIDRCPDRWIGWVASDRKTHNNLDRRGYAIQVERGSGEITRAFRRLVTTWEVEACRDPVKYAEIVEILTREIDRVAAGLPKDD